MADTIILGTLQDLIDEKPHAQRLFDANTSRNLTWLPGACITDLVVRREAPASLVAEASVIVESYGAQLLTLGPVTVRLVSPPDGERPLLVRLTLTPAPALDLYDLRVAIDLAQPWLHRIDPTTFRRTDEPFRLEADGRIRVAFDNSTDCECYGLSVPPFEIGRTGIVIALEDCQPAVGGSGVPVLLRDLLSNSGASKVEGVYARSARMYWIPQFCFPGSAVGAFSFNFRDVLLDGDGVSFTLDEQWPVSRVDGQPHLLSPRCAMLGRVLDNRLRVALERATGTVLRNEPVSLVIEGWIEIAPLKALLHARFFVDRNPDEDSGAVGLRLEQEPATTSIIDLGIGQVSISDFSCEGRLDDNGITVDGAAKIAITLPGWTSGELPLEAALEVRGDRTSMSASLHDVRLGPLGTLNASFDMTLVTENENVHVDSFGINASLLWRDVAALLHFGDLPPDLPVPTNDNAEVKLRVTWDDDGAVTLTLDVLSDDISDVFGFLPAPFRPETRDPSFGFRAEFADASSLFDGSEGDSISGEVYCGVSFRPVLPRFLQDNGIVTLEAGDADGFVDLEIKATLGDDGSAGLSMTIGSPLSVNVALPGIISGPIVTAALTSASVKLESDSDPDSAGTATIEFKGELAVLPASIMVSQLLGPQLAAFLEPLTSLSVHASLTGTLKMKDGKVEFAYQAEVADAELEFDLMEQIAAIAGGPAGSQRGEGASQRASRQELGADLSFRFALDGIGVQIGDLEATDAGSIPASIEVRFSAGVAGATLPVFVRVSQEELAIGVEGAKIPLQLPKFPITPADLQAAAVDNGRWTATALGSLVRDLQDDADALSDGNRHAQAQRGALLAKVGLITYLLEMWKGLSSNDARKRYQDGVTVVITILSEVESLTHGESKPVLEITGAVLRIPFGDPRNLAVEGGAKLTGFVEKDPLHGLNDVELRLGLSPDQIYFSIEGSGRPIEFDLTDRYVDGTVNLSQLAIGYGFTRNSLAVAFAGELVYPKNLTEDIDTADDIGFGIKLPRYNRLAFRLDIIPVPGPIPVVPLVEFSFDLRTPGLPALRGTHPCEPMFDGFELDAPGIIRADVKAIAVSPMLGIIPAANFRFDGDLQVGNEEFGVTIICDDLLWLAGAGVPPTCVPIQFLIDPTAPFFNHLCVNIHCAGFGINFDLERPFPLPDPRMIFEVLTLIADPMAPIDMRGALARSFRIALNDAYISIPRWARPLIPGSNEIVREEIDLELNIGTLIAGAQWMARTAGPIISDVQNALAEGAEALQRLQANPPQIDPDELLALLPVELRRFRARLSLAGFSAAATIIIITPDEAVRQAANEGVWGLSELVGFTRDDLVVMPETSITSAVLAAANVDILGVLTARFFGFLADDGSFALTTSMSVGGKQQLPLMINGLSVPLPLELDGRLSLGGKVNATSCFAAVRAQGRGSWDVFPGLLHIALGVRKPVELSLDSTGRFSISGDGRVDFFGGALQMTGMLSASESHLAVSGEIAFKLGGTPRNPAVALIAAGALHLGPGQKWGFDGMGVLRLFDLTLADAAVRLSNQEVALHVAIPRTQWQLGRLRFNSLISGELDGRVLFSGGGRRQPSTEMHLRGRGTIEAMGAKLKGSLAVDANDDVVRVAAEGELFWLNRRWLAARMALSSDGSAEFAGRASVVLDITPSGLGIEVASLFFRADISAEFGFNSRGTKISHAVDIDWSLGVRMPGGKPAQVFVLAMQKMKIKREQPLNRELINIQGMTFVPFADVKVPIPVFKVTKTEKILRTKVHIPVIDQARFMMTKDLKKFLNDSFGDGFVTGKTVLFKVPTEFGIDKEDRTLGELAAEFAFRVRVRWKDDKLGFEIQRGSQKTFFGLDGFK